MKTRFWVTIVLVAACGERARDGVVEQAIFDCADPAQRFTCEAPENPNKRFVCHATGNGFVKLEVAANSSHGPGSHGDQDPGASANDTGGSALDCECQERICEGTCSGAAAGTECDDEDKCTGLGSCDGDTCEPGVPTCTPGAAVDACNVQSGACDADTGACSTEPRPRGTPCGGHAACDGAGTCSDLAVTINEIESSGGVPGDWIEIVNNEAFAVDVSGWIFKDSDDTHAYVLPAGSVIAAGGYLVLDEAQFGFGLGAADSARLFDGSGALVVSYAWTAHAATTYGRCPDGTGELRTATSSTKGAANDCSILVRINEIESSGGVPGDWVELVNAGPIAVDLSGWTFKDNDDTHAYVLPTGTVIAPGAYLVLDEAQFGFGLGAADSARLFDGTSTAIDSHSWTTHAVTTYGRCPDGTGAFRTATASTKGAANDCTIAVRINEIESSGGTPGDWVEIVNTGPIAFDLSGWTFKDNDDTHAYVLPAGTSIAAGGRLVLDEAQFGFGLGAADSARLFDAGNALIDGFAWTSHAVTTYGRCPDGTGAFGTSTTSTKGAANDCSIPVAINEIESSGGSPGDWVEIVNNGPVAVDVTGWTFKDNDDTHAYVLPAGSVIAAGGYLVLDEAQFGFGLGAADSARLFASGGALIDSYAWTTHAAVTYGRCPNGSGAFANTAAATKGAANSCTGGPPTAAPWPGSSTVATVDNTNVFGANLSGIFHDGSVLWAVRNGPETLFRLIWDGTVWTPDPAGWSAGRQLRYPSGTGQPDAEDVTQADGATYVATERDNAVSGVSRPSILRFDVTAGGSDLIATHEWNLAGDLPAVGSNLGLEAITWIPDSYLVANGFFDERLGHTYAPIDYANHGSGLFFVGLEANGVIYAYALDHVSGGFARVATIASGDVTTKALAFDRDVGWMWSHCGAPCSNRTSLLSIDTNPLSATFGRFVRIQQFSAPAGMPNIANEGIAIEPESACVAGFKRFFWTDDSATDGHSLRAGTIPCGRFVP